MRKKWKRMSALLLALVMMLSLSVTAGASSVDTDTDTDTTQSAALKVSGLDTEDTVTIKAYQIVEEDDTTGTYKWVSAVESLITKSTEDDSFTADDLTYENIAAIAAAIRDNDDSVSSLETIGSSSWTAVEGEPGSYTATVSEAGTWLVLVTGDVSTVYNPMIVSAYYDSSSEGEEAELVGGTVSGQDNWNGDTAYAKASDPEFEKTIVDSSSEYDSGDDVAIGDVVTFQIATSFPDYNTDYYDEVSFKITDKMDAGLDYNGHLRLIIGGDEVDVEDVIQDKGAYVTVYESAIGTAGVSSDGSPDEGEEATFTIVFDSDYVLEHAGESVTVLFEAVLNENATVNFEANTNTAYLSYTNDPSEGTTYDTDSTTYHYTFGIDASLNGGDDTTHEVTKVKEAQDDDTDTDGDGYVALAGATFQLLADDKETVIATAVSDDSGYLNFEGLDVGTYYLQETAAPKGYAVDSTMHEVKITATYNQDGTLNSYAITIDGKYTSSYVATYEQNEEISSKQDVVTASQEKDEGVSLVNYEMGELPSTGGIGSTIFTVAGCLIMILAAGLFFATRRRRQQ